MKFEPTTFNSDLDLIFGVAMYLSVSSELVELYYVL